MKVLNLSLNLFLISLVLPVLWACQPNQNTPVTAADLVSRGYNLAEDFILLDTFRVLGPQGEALSQAEVLIGYEAGVPFENNIVVTDASGSFVAPVGWTAELPVTINALGYMPTTFNAVSPSPRDFNLALEEPMDGYMITGMVEGFENLRVDGHVDLGLIIPAFTRADLVQFDIASVLSPQNDELSIGAFSFGVPSNTSIPAQEEKYGFIKVKLNKPEFRLFYPSAGPKRVMANHTRFPLKQVVDSIQGNDSILNAVNYFDFLNAGFQDIEVTSSSTTQNVTLNQLKFDAKANVQAPDFDQNLVLFALTAAQVDNYLVPTDLKILNPRQKKDLRTFETADRYKIFLLSEQENSFVSAKKWRDLATSGASQEKIMESLLSQMSSAMKGVRMSLALQDLGDPSAPYIMPFVEAPQLSPGKIEFQTPQVSDQVKPLATYLTLSEVETISGGEIPLQKKRKLWETLTSSWVNKIDLPKIDIEKRPNCVYRWEVFFLAHEGSDNLPIEGLSFEDVTHITRSSIDL